MNRDIEASKSFLQSERSIERQNQPSTSNTRSTNNPILHELIKCFCGICETWFKKKSIERALTQNGEQILNDEESKVILKKFIIYWKAGSKFDSEAEEIIKCFELSQAILNGEKDLEENRADLDDLCYTEAWEDDLTKSIEDGTTDDFFHDLMIESAKRLEKSKEFFDFREELKNKLGLHK